MWQVSTTKNIEFNLIALFRQMFQKRFEVVLVAKGENEVGLVDHQNLERVLELQVAGLDVGDDARGNSDDDVGNVADEQLLLGLDALDVGHVDAADDSTAAVGQLRTEKAVKF